MTPEEFVYQEAALLDQRRFEEWLGLYTDDAVYWLPQRDGDDPSRDIAIIYDDWQALRGRVVRLRSGFAYSQEPPSKTCHLVGNVRVAAENAGTMGVSSSLVIVEARRGDQNVYAGSVEHTLVPCGSDGYHIQRKVVRLLNADTPLGNLSFLI